jgi:hypothetical protein
MGWLRSLFAQGEINRSLRAECEFHSTRCTELESKLEASEARLMREINSNRKREDEYKAEIVAMASPQLRLPLRENLDDVPIVRVSDPKEPPPMNEQDKAFEQIVINRAEEFRMQAQANGIEYNDA